MKRTALALTLILALLISAVAGTCLVDNAVCRGSLTVVVNSPQNGTYTSNNIAVSISASDPEMHIGPESVAYSVDGGTQVIIASVHVGMHSLTGGTVLSLPNGVHSIVGVGITWYNGTDGVFYSSPVYFTVDSPYSYVPAPTPGTSPSSTPTPIPPSYNPTPYPSHEPTSPLESQPSEAFPTILVIASIVILGVVCTGLLVYFKKRKL
jgi:hypothetical protein